MLLNETTVVTTSLSFNTPFQFYFLVIKLLNFYSTISQNKRVKEGIKRRGGREKEGRRVGGTTFF